MTQEIEKIAKYATDSYFNNMDPKQVQDLIISGKYFEAYTKAYLEAEKAVTATLESKKEKENLANQFH